MMENKTTPLPKGDDYTDILKALGLINSKTPQKQVTSGSNTNASNNNTSTTPISSNSKKRIRFANSVIHQSSPKNNQNLDEFIVPFDSAQRPNKREKLLFNHSISNINETKLRTFKLRQNREDMVQQITENLIMSRRPKRRIAPSVNLDKENKMPGIMQSPFRSPFVQIEAKKQTKKISAPETPKRMETSITPRKLPSQQDHFKACFIEALDEHMPWTAIRDSMQDQLQSKVAISIADVFEIWKKIKSV